MDNGRRLIAYVVMSTTIIHGDCLEELKKLDDNSVDAVITDPPYGLSNTKPAQVADVLKAWVTGDTKVVPGLKKDSLEDAFVKALKRSTVLNADNFDANLGEELVAFRVPLGVIPVSMFRAVDFNNNPLGGEEEVNCDGTIFKVEHLLRNDGDTEGGECISGNIFRLRRRSNAPCSVTREGDSTRIRVSIWLGDDSFTESEGSSGVMAGGATEVVAVLSLDAGRGTAEFLPTDSALPGDFILKRSGAESVGAITRTGGLPSVLESGEVSEVDASADGAGALDIVVGLPVGWHESHSSTSKGFMGASWDGFVPPPAVWEECMRVLKPGGHMAVFAGARTQDLMGLSIRLAGFEIRDTLGWVYGSGFPKSLDVGKAIDKQKHKKDDTLRFTLWLREQCEVLGISKNDLDNAAGTSDMGGWWTSSLPHRCAIPTAEQWESIAHFFPALPDWAVPLIAPANQPGEAWEKREITQVATRELVQGDAISFDQRSSSERERRDIPASDAAKQWDGWGTALKPAIEPVIYAQKPLDNHGIVNLIGSHIYRLEAQCSSTAANAEQSSKHTPAESNGAMESTAHENAATHTGDSRGSETPTGNLREDSSEGTGTPLSGSMANTCPNTVMSWRASWEELCKLMSTSTTSTTTEVTTDLRTLLSCISQITVESTPTSPTPALISGSHASVVGNLFAAIVGRLSATLELSAIENATSNIPTSSQGGGGETRTAIEPIILARKPLVGTVAANVLAHGVGGLNIDACRVGTEVRVNPPGSTNPRVAMGDGWNEDATPTVAVGRFPANVLLDEHAAKEMDKQSGVSVSSVRLNVEKDYTSSQSLTPDSGKGGDRGHSDSGGASRFFPVFKYQAKAPKRERPVIEREDGTKIQHPTVKPVALMEWLVTLITPPGGVVLDPFAGSGTTLQAALNKGFTPIGIEQDADYIKLIEQRLAA